MNFRRFVTVAVAAGLVLAAGACSTSSSDAQSRSIGVLNAAASPTTTSTTAPTASFECHDPRQSLRPTEPLPAPAAIKPDSSMGTIKASGHLVVGVDEGTKNWGYRDPKTGQIDGLDVDLLRAIADAIFGDGKPDDHLHFVTLTTAQRVDAVADKKVDMVASLLTATCDRWQKVDFSTEYYTAHQDVLVPGDSAVTTIAALAAKRVCATKGSTSIENIREQVPKAVLYPVAARADCLVALREGDVDAITSDDTILASFQAQENVKHTKVLGEKISDEHYAVAIARDRPDLVQFVNSVLENMRQGITSPSLHDLYVKWLGDNAPPAPPLPNYLP